MKRGKTYMGFTSYNDDDSPMIEYKFRFIGEQERVYQRLNAYESDDVWYANVEFYHPIEKCWRKEQFTATGRQVTRKDIIEYLTYPNNCINEDSYPFRLPKIYENDEQIIVDGVKAYQKYN